MAPLVAGCENIRLTKEANISVTMCQTIKQEYQGLENGLDYVWKHINCNGLYIRGDSEIVINQINGVYEVHSENVRPYYIAAMESLGRLSCSYWNAKWVPRNENWRADYLANEAIDEYH